MHIGDYIRSARLAAGVTQDDLGRAAGVSGQAVSQWERGETVPEVERIPVIARALKCSSGRLLTGRDDPTPGIPNELADIWAGLGTPEKRASALAVLRALTGTAA